MVDNRRARATRPGYVDGYRFREARLVAGFDRNKAAWLLAVTPRTIRNWERGCCRVPYSAFKLMRILSGYALPGVAWRGWSIRGDTLWSPTGRGFDAPSMGYLSLVFAMARQWQRERHAASLACVRVGAVPSVDPCPVLTASGGGLDVKSGHGSVAGGGPDAAHCPAYPLPAKPGFFGGLSVLGSECAKAGQPRSGGPP